MSRTSHEDGPPIAATVPSRRTILRGSLAAAAAGAIGMPLGGALAQGAFPSKPIEILVPWGPGGGPSTISDVVAKTSAAAGLSKQPMVLNHKPGASGLIGTALVAAQKGNPYVFMPGGGALLLQAVTGETKIDPLKDLTPLALSTLDSSVVIVAAS
jgi:tripartite-type tricarboxylate transporter receptor subunit TctC